MTLEDAFIRAMKDRGTAAGTWYEIRDEESARRVLIGIQDGDPEILDTFPAPSWGGEWADEPTYEDLAEEAGLSPTEANDAYGDAVAAFSEGVEEEIERAARYMLDGGCLTCGAAMNPVARALGPICGDCCRANHRRAVS